MHFCKNQQRKYVLKKEKRKKEKYINFSVLEFKQVTDTVRRNLHNDKDLYNFLTHSLLIDSETSW